MDVDFDPATDSHGFYGTYKLNGEIALNDYYQDGKLDLVWHSGAFTIANGQQVVFSRGNLQYAHLASGTREAQTWRFAKHQFDYVGGVDNDDVQQGNVVQIETADLGDARSNNENIGEGDYYGWIDLYGFGTGNNPTNHETENNSGGYTDWNEWGENNIVNSGKPGNTSWWTTLSHNDWSYLTVTRGDKSKVGLAKITGTGFGNPQDINGLVLLPDVFVNPYSWTPLSSASALSWASYDDNIYTVEQWRAMEEAGAVFLPAAGWRNGTNFRATMTLGSREQEHGAYYSKTQRTQTTSVYSLRFGTDYETSDRLNPDYYMAPDNGHAVRLVHVLQ